jgi:hypothetical protein
MRMVRLVIAQLPKIPKGRRAWPWDGGPRIQPDRMSRKESRTHVNVIDTYYCTVRGK